MKALGDSSADNAKEHVRDAVLYRNPSSHSARPMIMKLFAPPDSYDRKDS
jgi:hypothetical protein